MLSFLQVILLLVLSLALQHSVFWPAETEMAGGDRGLGHLIGLHKGRV